MLMTFYDLLAHALYPFLFSFTFLFSDDGLRRRTSLGHSIIAFFAMLDKVAFSFRFASEKS